MSPRKKILFIHRHAPFGTACAQETLDILLMASTFNQDISVAFIDDAVFQLASEQNANVIESKNFSAAFKALSLYDIQNVYIEKESLEIRGLSAEELMIPVKIVNSDELKKVIAQQDVVFND